MMKNILFPFLMMIWLLTGCGDGSDGGIQSKSNITEAKGGRHYGGIFKMNEVGNFRSLYPLAVTEVTSHRITNQIYEGLVGLSQSDLSVVPVLADRWEVNEDGTKYTFHLRKGVYFHDDPCFPDGKGREVTANDFKYTLTKLCEADVNNKGDWLFKDRVKGCTEYFVSTQTGKPLPEGVTGIKVIDDYTLSIELERPFASFLQLMATPFTAVFPREAFDKYGIEMRTKTVGTGPFKVKAIREDDAVILVKNENYWGKDEFGNQLPFLDGIKVSFIKTKETELLEFKKGNLDMVYRFPLDLIEDIIDREGNLQEGYKQYTLQMKPSLTIQYYGFLHPSKLFSNINVRKAFNYAIDRDKIVDYTMKGTAVAAHYGIVPPGLKGYDYRAVKGFEYDPEKARDFLAKAGYPNGEGFPEINLQINEGGGTNEQIAEAIQKMLQENLNIRIDIIKLAWPQHLENVETGKALFWRLGWIADYPDPENFLNLFYGKHVPPKLSDHAYINSIRYKSARFDSLFKKALRTQDEDERNLLYLKADQVIIDDAAVMPIFYNKDHRLLQPYVRNFPQNPMEYRIFKEVYFEPSAN